MRGSFALCMLLAACGDDAGTMIDAPAGIDASGGGNPVVTSGSRLRARFLEAEGGERRFVGWRDTMLDVDCSWTVGDEPRCLPEPLPIEVYADAACEEPVYRHYESACLELPTHVYDVGACGRVETVHLRGAQFSPTALYARTSAGCEVTGIDASSTYYRTMPDPDAERYAQGMLVTGGEGRVQTRAIAGPDGSLEPRQAFDTRFEVACTPVVGSSEPTGDVCRPESDETIFSAAPDCSSPLVVVEETCPERSFIYMYGRGLFRRGAAYTGDPAALEVYRQLNGTCRPFDRGPIGPTEIAFFGGEAIASTELVPAARVRDEAATTRLQAWSWSASEYRRPTGEFYDTQRSSDCTPVKVGAASWRCLPPSDVVQRGFFFSDDTCTTPIAVIVGYLRASTAVDHGDTCTVEDLRIFERGAELGTLYYDAGAGCEVYPDVGTPNYAVGAELPLSSFAELSPVTD